MPPCHHVIFWRTPPKASEGREQFQYLLLYNIVLPAQPSVRPSVPKKRTLVWPQKSSWQDCPDHQTLFNLKPNHPGQAYWYRTRPVYPWSCLKVWHTGHIISRTSQKAQSHIFVFFRFNQGGITCGAIEDPRKSSKAIDERVIINFRDKNGVIARFRDKNVVIVRFCDKNVLSIASLFYR